jgi:dTDP-4-amino-4,6-dideoxygalactose transaminase
MINVTKTHLPDKAKYLQYIDRIYENGWLTNHGEIVQELEKRLSDYLDVPYLVLVANGTLALQVAVKLLELEGEVITTPFSFVATTSSLVWEGLKVRFADIDRESLNLDPEKVEPLINRNSSALVPVHVYGNPCDVDQIQKIATQHGLKVIYDAAHAFGVSLGEKGACGFGDVSILSFHSTKLFHTIEGGALVIHDKALYEKAKLLINFGIAGPESIQSLGINAKMNEFEAAMGMCILDDMEMLIEERKKAYNKYADALGTENELSFQQPAVNRKSNYSYFPVIFPSEGHLLMVKRALESKDIYPRRYFYPSLSSLSYVDQNDPTPVADDISKRILCLPLYHDLPEGDQQQIITIVKQELQRNP